MAPHLDSPGVNTMIQEHLIDEANLHYTDFIKDLIKLMVSLDRILLSKFDNRLKFLSIK